MFKKAFIWSVSALLISCGNGLEDRVNHDENIVTISGVYNTSRPVDAAYLYIAKNGEVSAYDYQGDSTGTGDNCYTLAAKESQINVGLNGGSVTYSDDTKRYTITGGGNTLSFLYDTQLGMYKFILDSAVSSDKGINMIAGNTNINIGNDGSKKIDSPSIDIIKSSICI